MRHISNPLPVEEGRIPPEVRVEALASKARVKARIEEVAARIKSQELKSQELKAQELKAQEAGFDPDFPVDVSAEALTEYREQAEDLPAYD